MEKALNMADHGGHGERPGPATSLWGASPRGANVFDNP
jgi:hypothetical protein